jgi:hypothetical protein
MKKLSILLVALVSACLFAGDATYMRVNDAVVSEKEYQQYASFIGHFIPAERKNDSAAFKKEVESYITELLLVKSAAKTMGKEFGKDQFNAVLEYNAKQAGISVDEFKENLKKEGIDSDIYAEHQLSGQLLGAMIYENYQSAFTIDKAQVEAKKKALSHDQIEATAAVIHERVLTKEEKAALKKALKAEKSEGKVEFSQMGWQPVEAFAPIISDKLKKLSKGQDSEIIAFDGRNIVFHIKDKRFYEATDAQAKDVLFNEFIAEKRQKWLADKKKAARIVIY